MVISVPAFCAPTALPRLARAAPRNATSGRRGARASASSEEGGDPKDGAAGKPEGSSAGQQRAKPTRATRKPSAFENTIDDLTMKRMGRGSIYYGKREPGEETTTGPLIFEPKTDPVVVAGATGRTGQWVALGLLAQGFNVRAVTRAPRRAETLFGPAGANVDVAKADLTRPDTIPEALAGASALVVSVASPRWLPGAMDKLESEGVVALIRAAEAVPSIKRVVMIVAADRESPQARTAAVDALKESGMPYVVLRVGGLNESAGGEIEIVLRAAVGKTGVDGGSGDAKLRQVGRIDLAQVVCQALVYGRSMEELQETDPDGEFDFPNCVVDVENGPNPYIPNRRFWRSTFNTIAAAFREKVPVDDTEEEGDSGVSADASMQEDTQAGASM